MTTLPREVFARFVREEIERHDEWDSLHHFLTLHQEGGGLRIGTFAAIDPAIHPNEYPDMMAGIAHKELEEGPDDPACAYLLQIEAWGVTEPRKGATLQERMQFQADRLGRTIHQRDDAYEQACAYLADVHGRLWSATKRRDQPGVIAEQFHPPGPRQPGGQMISGLLCVAQATGMATYGLPGPANLRN